MNFKMLQSGTQLTLQFSKESDKVVECDATVYTVRDDNVYVDPSINISHSPWFYGRSLVAFTVIASRCFKFDFPTSGIAKKGERHYVKLDGNVAGIPWERRRHARYSTSIPCLLKSKHTGIQVDGLIKDVSAEGMRVQTDHPFACGSIIIITFKSPATESLVELSVEAGIRRQSDGDIGLYITPGDKDIKKLVDKLRQERNEEIINEER